MLYDSQFWVSFFTCVLDLMFWCLTHIRTQSRVWYFVWLVLCLLLIATSVLFETLQRVQRFASYWWFVWEETLIFRAGTVAWFWFGILLVVGFTREMEHGYATVVATWLCMVATVVYMVMHMRDTAAESTNETQVYRLFFISISSIRLYWDWFEVVIIYGCCLHGMGLETFYFAADWSLLLEVLWVVDCMADSWYDYTIIDPFAINMLIRGIILLWSWHGRCVAFVTWSLYVFMFHSYLLEDWFKFGYAGRLGRLDHVYASSSICYKSHSY